MKTTIFLLLNILLFSGVINSQSITGKVFGNSSTGKEPLTGVTVKWDGTNTGTTTGPDGTFEIKAENSKNRILLFNHIGYEKKSVEIRDILYIEVILNPENVETETIDVEGEKKSTYFEDSESKKEVITSQELVKDACCDLSGCFGRNSSVDVAVTDIVTDSKELKVLGLEGVYTQLLVENMPVLTGLSTKYGISAIPGTLIDKIMISKGSNSILQGYESISGIINVMLKDNDNSDKIFLNGFMNSTFEKQINGNFSKKFGKKWSSILSLHTTQKGNQSDENKDTFLDFPLVTRYMIYNKWTIGKYEDKTQFMTAGKILYEKRTGGQTGFDPEINEGNNSIYGQTVNIKSGDIYTRFSHQMKNKNEIKVLASALIYDIKSFYGITKYEGKQNSLNLNAVYEMELGNDNFLKAGISYKREDIKENISFMQNTDKTYEGYYRKYESVPGIFAEHSVTLANEKLSIMSGIRLDHHNKYNLIFTPRILARLQLTDKTVIRASAGTGFRTVNLFNEYANLLASGRDINITEELRPEKMINYGIDILQYFNFRNISGSLNIDYYRTNFNNKIIPDYDTDPSRVIFSNLNGNAVSDIFQSELNLTILNNIDLKLAYKFLNNKYKQNGTEYEQPFIAKHRITSTVSYTPKNKSWSVSAGMQWFGKQRLPSTENNPAQYRRGTESKPYTLINAQVSKNFKFLELYAGAENIFDIKQEDPIISAKDPFSKYFDTSYIWGPTKGREIYAGFRLKFN